MIKITTESGSVYLIDDGKKTWARERGEGAAEIRSDEGTFITRSGIVLGKSLILICPPLDKEVLDEPRLITSTYVVDIDWEFDNG